MIDNSSNLLSSLRMPPAKPSLSDQLPPVVRLLLDEPVRRFDDFDHYRKYFKTFRPELERQAEWTIDHYSYVDGLKRHASGRNLVIAPAPGLNPLTNMGKCRDLRCRINYAYQFSRSLGLYADTVVLRDPFTSVLLFQKKWTTEAILSFMTNWMILRELRPLIESGVVQFEAPMVGLCRRCHAKITRIIDDVASELVAVSIPQYQIVGTQLLISPPLAEDSNLVFPTPLTRKQLKDVRTPKKAKAITLTRYTKLLRSDIRQALFTAQAASSLNAVIFSHSLIDIQIFQRIEGRSTIFRADLWESANSASLPWINGLSVAQVVLLRQHADRALPRFREELARSIGNPTTSRLDHVAVLQRLRQEAAEIEAELKTIKFTGGKPRRTAYGFAALAFGAVGFTAEPAVATAAAAGLVAVLNLLHNSNLHDADQMAKLSTKPGYVMVKARELVEHAGKGKL